MTGKGLSAAWARLLGRCRRGWSTHAFTVFSAVDFDISRALSNWQTWILWEGRVSERAFAQEVDTFLCLDVPGVFAIQTETYVGSIGVGRVQLRVLTFNAKSAGLRFPHMIRQRGEQLFPT